MGDVIEGIKLIEHNMGGYNAPDEPGFGPFMLTVRCRVPGFLEVAATFIYGEERIRVRGKTREALELFVERNGLRTHPRLKSLEITEDEQTRPAA